jgi:hypothetical protein
MDDRRRAFRRRLAAAAAVALALRLAFSFGYWTGQVLTRDEREYLSLARGIADGRGFAYDADVLDDPGEPFGRAPGYPLFLAIVGGGRDVATEVPASVKAAQAAAGACGVILLGLLAARIAGERAGIAAAVIAAIYPPLVWISSYAFSEALFWPVGVGLAMLLDHAAAHPRHWRAVVVAGVVAGACVLVRPGTLLFLPLAAILMLRRGGVMGAAVFTVATLLVILPWTARNVLVHGRVVLVASEGGITFWTGNNALARGEGDLAANPHLKAASERLRSAHPGLSEEAMEPIYYRESLAWIRAHPLDYVTLLARKVFFLIVPVGPSYRLHSTLYFTASLLSYGALLALAIPGGGRLRGRFSIYPGVWLLAASAIATCIVFFPQERFRIPILDPALIVCAAGLFRIKGAAS